MEKMLTTHIEYLSSHGIYKSTDNKGTGTDGSPEISFGISVQAATVAGSESVPGAVTSHLPHGRTYVIPQATSRRFRPRHKNAGKR